MSRDVNQYIASPVQPWLAKLGEDVGGGIQKI